MTQIVMTTQMTELPIRKTDILTQNHARRGPDESSNGGRREEDAFWYPPHSVHCFPLVQCILHGRKIYKSIQVQTRSLPLQGSTYRGAIPDSSSLSLQKKDWIETRDGGLLDLNLRCAAANTNRRSGMGPFSVSRRNGSPPFFHSSVLYGESVYAMSFLLLRTNPIHSRCIGLSLCRVLNVQTVTLYQPIRHFTYKKNSELTRKEREIIRYD